MSRETRKRSLPVRAALLVIMTSVIVITAAAVINIYMVKTTEGRIAAVYEEPGDTADEAETEALEAVEPECILVLGAAVNADGTPSAMLRDRLDVAVDLYEKGVAPVLLLSGDNGQMVYNEVQSMKDYVVAAGVPEEVVFLDHAGFSTYESVYRAKYIFGVERMVVVTQTYHLYRALYGCRSFGIEAVGAASDQKLYGGQEGREFREVLARSKDFVKWIFKMKPTFLGDSISLEVR